MDKKLVKCWKQMRLFAKAREREWQELVDLEPVEYELREWAKEWIEAWQHVQMGCEESIEYYDQ